MRFLVPAILSVILVIYGSLEARNLRTEFLVIHSSKIPREIGRIRVLQISDVHIGGAVGDGYVSRIIDAVRSADPDVILSTGDLVDGRGAYITDAARMFRQIRPRWGKFAVTGNHEFYLGVDRAVEFMHDAGFVPLRNSVATIAGAVDLVGVDDPGGVMNGKGACTDREILSRANKGHFTVLLKHRPVIENGAPGFFDLQLSGHTHKGQIFPFSLFTRLAFPYHAGPYHLPGGSVLHVSRGAGVWGPPVRLLAPPEITVIDLSAN
jgi:predicted MPP superfamily phosphohydrolase